MEPVRTFRDLVVWQKAHCFVLDVYKVSQSFPPEECYGITGQLRRACVSVPTNIVEGQAKNTTKDFVRYLYIARGSLSECEYLLRLSLDLGYLPQTVYQSVESNRQEVAFLLSGLIRSLK
ncbi:four helix bundle protein [Candidatus Uhrbacteria bacterium]|nr:four helix bundle protein [Candidatus Uhrbacteria bacterium]